MKRSLAVLGVSLALTVAGAPALQSVAGAASGGAPPSQVSHSSRPNLVVPSTWSIVPSPDVAATTDEGFLGDSCVSSIFCMAVGYASNGTVDQTLAEQWNGSAWSIVPSPNPPMTLGSELDAVSCLSSTFCMAIGRAYDSGDHHQTLVE